MELFNKIRQTIEQSYPDLKGINIDFQPTPENQTGDFGFPCFVYAKVLKTSPVNIASKLASLSYPDIIEETKTAGPYLNFSLDRNVFATELVSEILSQKELFGSGGEGKGKRVLLEHTSINPNASPHIGRSRNGLIGDTLARLFRFEGYDVNVHYYVNDMGKQIGLLVMQAEDKKDLRFHEVLDLYVEANQRAKDDPDFEAKGFDLLMRMEHGDPEVTKAFGDMVNICLNGQLEVLGRLGLTYDTFDRESTFLHDARMDEAMEVFNKQGALFTDEHGRKVLDLQKLGYCSEEGRYIVLKRANGSTMYMYRDIAYTLEKIERGGDMNLIVLGEDHKMYFEQMETIIRSLGKTPPVAVHYSYILLKEGKMSTRQGNVVLLADFLDEAVQHARAKVEVQWPDMPEDERGEIARIIGIGAVRFAILSVRPNRNVIFDWETALSFTGDSGPYIQYSCTRIASILRKHGSEPETLKSPLTLTHDAEWGLVFRLAAVPQDISSSLKLKNPGILATTALDIARRFSVFYNECPVLSAENEKIRDSRIAICVAARQALMNLLGLLGINAPERM
ncbi:MAG: arginine--tRNA ligase [Candidatus Latescibacteria bacterium]|nr:arginine--tRNA ligase [Candidatus Latescibacterota bacterium]